MHKSCSKFEKWLLSRSLSTVHRSAWNRLTYPFIEITRGARPLACGVISAMCLNWMHFASGMLNSMVKCCRVKQNAWPQPTCGNAANKCWLFARRIPFCSWCHLNVPHSIWAMKYLILALFNFIESHANASNSSYFPEPFHNFPEIFERLSPPGLANWWFRKA